MFVVIRLNVPDHLAEDLEVAACTACKQMLIAWGVPLKTEGTVLEIAENHQQFITSHQTEAETSYEETIFDLTEDSIDADTDEISDELLEIALDGIRGDIKDRAALQADSEVEEHEGSES